MTYISDEPVCDVCTLELVHVAVLGTSAESLLCSINARVVEDSRGRFIVDPACGDGQLLVLDETGQRIRVLGRSGEGPGELRQPWLLAVGANDEIHVFELNRRHSVFSANYELIGTGINPGVPFDVILELTPRLSIQHFLVPSPELVGLPIHVVTNDGKTVSSFGSQDEPYLHEDAIARQRQIAADRAGNVWVARRTAYELELWSLSGVLLRKVSRLTDWFAAYSQPSFPPVAPFLQDLKVDADGRLWTIVSVKGDDNEAQLGPEGHPNAVAASDLNGFFDTVIEVLDVESGVLISRVTSDLYITSWLGDHVYSFRDDANGDLLADIWRVRLDGMSK